MTLAVSLFSILDDCRGAGYSSQLSDCLSVLDFSTCERIAEESCFINNLISIAPYLHHEHVLQRAFRGRNDAIFIIILIDTGVMAQACLISHKIRAE